MSSNPDVTTRTAQVNPWPDRLRGRMRALARVLAAFLYAYIYGILSGRKLCDTLEGFVFHCLAGAIFECLFLFSLLGLVWAVAAPGWVDRLFQRAAFKLVLLLALLGMLGLPFALLGSLQGVGGMRAAEIDLVIKMCRAATPAAASSGNTTPER